MSRCAKAALFGALLVLSLLASAACSIPAEESVEPSGSRTSDAALHVQGAPEPASNQGQRQRDEQKGSANAFATRMTRWSKVHAFISSPIEDAKALGAREGMALTEDNLVGITKDGGRSWHFAPHTLGSLEALSGYAGGPYVVVGKGGSIGVSEDGVHWRALPRFTGASLVDVERVDGNFAALTARGDILLVDLKKEDVRQASLPDGFSAEALARDRETLIALGRDGDLMTTNGIDWSPLKAPTKAPLFKRAATSQGICKLGRVGLRRGVKCAVSGTVHRVGERYFVDTLDTLAVSQGDEAKWHHSARPSPTVHHIFGDENGPFFALGGAGSLSSSPKGEDWTQIKLGTERTFKDGVVDKELVLIVGEKGTIARSEDLGGTWDIIQTPFGATLKHVSIEKERIVALADALVLVSLDRGKTWGEKPANASTQKALKTTKRPSCGASWPPPETPCIIWKERSSPKGLPNVHGLHFNGDSGVAYGDSGLLMMSDDGGRTWTSQQGLGFGRIEEFEVSSNVVAALNRSSLAVSSDGGRHFHLAKLPSAMIGGLEDVLITPSGSVYVCGKKGFIIKSEGTLQDWLPLNTGEKNTQHFVHLFRVETKLYAAGKRGELLRSTNAGATWQPLALGLKGEVFAMSGAGERVFLLVAGQKDEGWLLESKDGGAHFALTQRFARLSPEELRADFSFSEHEGALYWGSKHSMDNGRTWFMKRSKPQKDEGFDAARDVRVEAGRVVIYEPASDRKIEVILPFQPKELSCSSQELCWLRSDFHIFRSSVSM